MRKLVVFLFIIISLNLFSQELNLNKPEREQWFTELGFGMFIHWSYDVQYGMVISHSLVGASDDYLKRYFNDLPKTFNPSAFNPHDWAKKARLAGMKYMVFTTKHHNGFCMWDTKSTDYNIMNTPFSKDAVKEFVDACRAEGLAVGFYFSPEDFYYQYKNGLSISRRNPKSEVGVNENLRNYVASQMKELMEKYTPVDIVFLDGQDMDKACAKVCWEVNPDVVVTRGAINTPEQETPESLVPSPWEACYTLGKQWQYRPTNEIYKDAGTTIMKLMEIKAKGGNLLMNIGPDPDGAFPPEQNAVLNEVGLWIFINKEMMDNTKPFDNITDNNGNFILQSKDEKHLYIIIPGPVPYGKWQEIQLTNIGISKNAGLSVLGHNGEILEYSPDIDPAPHFIQSDEGMKIKYMRAQRIYNDRQWPNPIVLKIENFRERN